MNVSVEQLVIAVLVMLWLVFLVPAVLLPFVGDTRDAAEVTDLAADLTGVERGRPNDAEDVPPIAA